jgi:hypothetical protein
VRIIQQLYNPDFVDFNPTGVIGTKIREFSYQQLYRSLPEIRIILTVWLALWLSLTPYLEVMDSNPWHGEKRTWQANLKWKTLGSEVFCNLAISDPGESNF